MSDAGSAAGSLGSIRTGSARTTRSLTASATRLIRVPLNTAVALRSTLGVSALDRLYPEVAPCTDSRMPLLWATPSTSFPSTQLLTIGHRRARPPTTLRHATDAALCALEHALHAGHGLEMQPSCSGGEEEPECGHDHDREREPPKARDGP
jgi:hypothetical protein